MLRCIVPESIRAAGDQVVQVIKKVLLESRIFRIHVRKTAHLSRCTFPTVSPVYYRIESICMEQVISASRCVIEILRYFVQIRGYMVRDHVYDHLDPVLVRLIAHSDKVISCSKLIIAYLPVRRLIMPPPAAVSSIDRIVPHDLHVGVRIIAGVGRRRLDRGEPCLSDVSHIIFDRIERPAPAVQDRAVFDLLCQPVLGGCRRVR